MSRTCLIVLAAILATTTSEAWADCFKVRDPGHPLRIIDYQDRDGRFSRVDLADVQQVEFLGQLRRGSVLVQQNPPSDWSGAMWRGWIARGRLGGSTPCVRSFGG